MGREAREKAIGTAWSKDMKREEKFEMKREVRNTMIKWKVIGRRTGKGRKKQTGEERLGIRTGRGKGRENEGEGVDKRVKIKD